MRRLAERAADPASATLPDAVRWRVAEIVRDTIGVSVAGSAEAFLAALRPALALGGPATVWGTHARAEPATAAFLNAAAGPATQLDDGVREVGGHPAIHIVPAVLAVAEQRGAAGAAVIEAVAAGYDVAVRVGSALGSLRPGLHSHGNWPVIGAAVGVARLLGADADQQEAAIEAAATLALQAPVLTALEGTTVHYYYTGLGAELGVRIGIGATAGMTASTGVLAGHFAAQTSGALDATRLDEARERHWVLDGYIKLDPVCAHLITAVEASRALRARIPSDARVAAVRVRTYAAAAALDDPAPATVLAGKFSIPYVVASTLTGRDPQAISSPGLDDAAVRELAGRVEVVADAAMSAAHPAERRAQVEASLADGTCLVERVDLPLGDAARPAGPDALAAKFLGLTVPVLGAQRAERLDAGLAALADCPDVRPLIALTRPVSAC